MQTKPLMMKTYSFLFLLCIAFLLSDCKSNKSILKDSSAQKESKSNDSKLFSSSTKMYLKDLEKQDANKLSDSFTERYAINRIGDQYYVGAIIRVDDSLESEKMKELGVITGTKVNDNLSIKVPVFEVQKLSIITGILYINIDQKVSVR